MINKCLWCDQDFKTKNSKRKFCRREHYNLWRVRKARGEAMKDNIVLKNNPLNSLNIKTEVEYVLDLIKSIYDENKRLSDENDKLRNEMKDKDEAMSKLKDIENILNKKSSLYLTNIIKKEDKKDPELSFPMPDGSLNKPATLSIDKIPMLKRIDKPEEHKEETA